METKVAFFPKPFDGVFFGIGPHGKGWWFVVSKLPGIKRDRHARCIQIGGLFIGSTVANRSRKINRR